MPNKEHTIYMKIVWTNEPTEYDKVGCDGLYVKEAIQINLEEIISDIECSIKNAK